MRKIWMFYCLCLTVISTSAQQVRTKPGYIEGNLTGEVRSSDSLPAAFVSIKLKGTNYGAVSNERGIFDIKAPVGEYVLSITSVGMKNLEMRVRIEETHETKPQTIYLQRSLDQLSEVQVQGKITNKQIVKSSRYVARMPLKNIENPQVYSVIPHELLNEQVVVDYAHALLNAPAVAPGSKDGNGQNNIMIRGFSDPGFVRDGLTMPQYGDVDPADLERIEVIKGPSGTLFGSGAQVGYGGLINRVTKKPKDYFFTDVTYTNGGYDFNRLTVDINTPVNKDSTALFRFNGALHREGSFQDYGFAKNALAAPVFSYKINDRADVVIGAEIYFRNATSTPILTIQDPGITNLKQLNSIYKKSFLTNEVYFKSEVRNLNAQLNYKLGKNWIFHTNLASAHTDYNYPFLAAYVNADTVVERQAGITKYNLNFLEVQEYVNGTVMTGKIRHRLLVGFDYLQRRHYFFSGRAAYDQFNYLTQTAPYVEQDNFNTFVGNITYKPSHPNENDYGVYASDVINFTDRLDVMLSGRYDRYVSNNNGIFNYKQGAFSPKLGIVYQLIKNKLSGFGSYMNGFQNVSGNDVNGRAFKPQHANQWEGGLKAELLNNRLSATLSYYDIKVENILRTDVDNPGFSIQDGTRSSKGAEFELLANPVDGLNLMVGYGNNASRYLKAAGGVEGNRPAYVPNNVFNYWVSYTIMRGSAAGLGIGTGGNYLGENYFNDQNTIIIGSSFVLSGSIFYDRPRYRLSFKLDNMTNLEYHIASTPQLLRRGLLSLALKM